MIPIVILGIVFILIAVRQLGNIRLQIWQIMLLGALVVLLTGQISPLDALKAINPDVMLFLFGVFIVGQALEESGYLAHLSYKIFRRAKSLDILTLSVLFVIGLLSAFLMNDTLAIIGTPVVLSLAKKGNMAPKVLLLALAFAVAPASAEVEGLARLGGLVLRLLRVLVGIAEMGHEDEAPDALSENVLDGGEGGHDSGVVLDHPVLHGDVEVDAHDDAFAGEGYVFYCLDHVSSGAPCGPVNARLEDSQDCPAGRR